MINLQPQLNRLLKKILCISIISIFISSCNEKGLSEIDLIEANVNFGKFSGLELKKINNDTFTLYLSNNSKLKFDLHVGNDTVFALLNKSQKVKQPLFIKCNYEKKIDTVLINEKKKIIFKLNSSIKYEDICIADLIIIEQGAFPIRYNFVFSFKKGLLQLSIYNLGSIEVLYLYPNKEYKYIDLNSDIQLL